MSPQALEQRQLVLLEAHANNLIEQMDMGHDCL